ncbi:MAG: hypothetical protein M0036_15620 [Desulfobacteraceae bacterium]|nr:hypothetical protein [Desulfobacteraceae bacterium]
MPAPAKQMLAELAKANFRRNGVSLPEKWRTPGPQYPKSYCMEERQVAPNSPLTLFQNPTLNKSHVDTGRDIGELFEKFIDGISAAICEAIGKWLKMASIIGMSISGPSGILVPGGLTGPFLTPLILSAAPKKTAAELRYSLAVAGSVGSQWMLWQMGVMGMLTFPSLAAVPGPMAPPAPNVPVPLMALPSIGDLAMSPPALKEVMTKYLGDPQAQHAELLFDALANAIGVVFLMFKSSTLVQNVMGTGPVPTFAPPVVPMGPVVGGSVIPAPGVLV